MLEYTVVTGDTWAEFVGSVHERIAEGWRPQGGVSVSWYEKNDSLTTALGKPVHVVKTDRQLFAQAMVKGE